MGKDDLQDIDGKLRPPITGLHENEDTTQRAQRNNYKEDFDWSSFIQNVKVPKKKSIGKTMRDSDGNFMYEKINSTDTVPILIHFTRVVFQLIITFVNGLICLSLFTRRDKRILML